MELLAVIVIVSIIATVAMKSLTGVNDVVRCEKTKSELNKLAWAVAGKPDLVSGGVRTDYGYIGDIGSLPPNLDALVTNPGAYGTWDGPYIRDDFYTSTSGSETSYKVDAWGSQYSYSGGITISSSGSGSAITRNIAGSIDDLLYNTISVVITDLGNTPPGVSYKDSITFLLTYPDGSGSTVTVSRIPGSDGFAQFDSIPVGLHSFRMVYIPDNDTLVSKVNVDPGHDCYTEIQHFTYDW